MPVRREIAALVLLLVCGFVATSVWDVCADDGPCPPDCHLSCAHGCGVQAVFAADRALVVPAPWIGAAGGTMLPPPASRGFAPEPQPPRA